MKRWLYIALLGLLVLGGVYVYLHRQDLGLVSSTASDSEQSGASQNGTLYHPALLTWQPIDRTPDGFKLDMPGDPKQIQIPAYNQQGGADQVNMLYVYPDAQTSFSIAWADDPPVMRASGRSPQLTLDTARDDALGRTQTTLVSQSTTSIGSLPAREFSARNVGGGVMNCRLIYDGQRLYMLIAAFPAASARRDEDVQHFFNSFTILNQ